MVTKNTYKIDIDNELENIKKDISDAEEAGIKQITLDYFAGAENEKEFLAAARELIRSRGYKSETEYEDGELVLTVRKAV